MALDLSEIRNNIDKLDSQLLQLFLQRMECSKQVAEYKVLHDIPVLNAKREQEILDEIAKKSNGNEQSTTLLFSTIMNISRAAQYPSVTKKCPLRKLISDSLADKFNPTVVGFQGTNGSYSQTAAKSLFKSANARSYAHFEDVFKAVSSGEIDAGVLPAENSYAGSVSENYDFLLKYDLKINAVIDMPINHCLLTLPGANISDVKTVCSHEQALNQCADYISQHKFEPKAMENTAFAAKYVAENGDKTVAAIASEQTAKLYELQIAGKNIQSAGENYTRFIAVSKNMAIDENADTVSIAFALEHSSGSLYKMLSMLAASGLNMTRIESRPDKESPFRYIFYVDFTGNVNDEKVASLLCGLYDELPMMKLLGNCKIIKNIE